MLTVNLTNHEYRIIRCALEREYYAAKDEKDDVLMSAINALETKLSQVAEKEDE